MRRRYSILFLLPFFINSTAVAQDSTRANSAVWPLSRTLQYAKDHNLIVRTAVVNEQYARLRYQQALLGQLPNVTGTLAYGRSNGRSVDPTTNDYVDRRYKFATIFGNANVLLFGWFAQRNIISSTRLDSKAVAADADQIRDDVALNVITGYLRALLSREQAAVATRQVAVSRAQLSNAVQFAAAGVAPELSVAQMQAQLSLDSASFLSATAAYNTALLEMRALLNLDLNTPFEPVMPATDPLTALNLEAITPESVFATAEKNFGVLRAAQYRTESAEKIRRAAIGSLLPQVSVNAQLGTNYTSISNSLTRTGEETVVSNAYLDMGGGTSYPIYQSVPTYSSTLIPSGTQFDNNLRTVVSLNLSVPLSNAWMAPGAIRQARLAADVQSIQLEDRRVRLRQAVYTAYDNARIAVQTYTASRRASTAAATAFNYARQRYEVGLNSTVEYLTILNTQYEAQLRELSARYDLLLRLKMLDYYSGKTLTLD